jgi:acyl-CoA synthetase (AMP-forming)/AMP-acid ligase II
MDFSKSILSIPGRFPFKVFPEIGVTVTGDSLRRYSGICASWLQDQGYKTIGIHMENCPEFLYLFAGALRAGVKSVLFNVLTPAETDLPLFDRERVSTLLAAGNPHAKEFTPYEWKVDEPLVVLSTSGTSGKRRTIEKSVKSYFGEKGVRPSWLSILRLLRVRIYNCSPWYHNTGITLMLLTLCGAQATEITAGHFNPDHMRRNINATRPNFILTTPSMLHRSICAGEIHLPSHIIYAGEFPTDRMIALVEKTGGAHFIYSSYASTETGIVAHMAYFTAHPGLEARILRAILRLSGARDMVYDRRTLPTHCAGTLLKKVDVRILKDGSFAAEGETGEIAVITPTMYSRSESGYYHTGDIGFLKDGRLFICGRRTFLINRSGEKILPEDIEDALSDLPGIQATAAFGIPSPTHGEDICLAVESRGGATVIDRADLEGRLPKHMVPQHLFFFDRFPLTESGKTDIAALRAEAMKKVARREADHLISEDA